MDVINFISKDTKLPDGHVRDGSLYGDGMPHFVDGPRIHEFLQEMHREVFAGREGLITVGEMPGVTVDEAKLYTDPGRRELDMVFQFEHVQVDHGPAAGRVPSSSSPTTQWTTQRAFSTLRSGRGRRTSTVRALRSEGRRTML